LLMDPEQEKEAEREKPAKSDTSEVVPSVAGHGTPIASPFSSGSKVPICEGRTFPEQPCRGVIIC
jgi:hypothetical protein